MFESKKDVSKLFKQAHVSVKLIEIIPWSLYELVPIIF